LGWYFCLKVLKYFNIQRAVTCRAVVGRGWRRSLACSSSVVDEEEVDELVAAEAEIDVGDENFPRGK
jgi:hypothetical protein